MLSFFAGLVVFFILLFSKNVLANLVLDKKKLFFRLFLILLGEFLIIFACYQLFVVQRADSQKFIEGFLTGLVTWLLYYVISLLFLKKQEVEKDG